MAQEQLIHTEYSEVMQKSYIDYAMSVIVARALPDVRDGLKPVQRRTLYDMYELGIRSDRPYRESAGIISPIVSPLVSWVIPWVNTILMVIAPSMSPLWLWHRISRRACP